MTGESHAPSEALARHRDEVLEIIARYPVTNPRLFGSAARGEDTEASDLDILVEPRGDITTFVHLDMLQGELARLLGVNVDVMTSGGFSRNVADRVNRDVRPL